MTTLLGGKYVLDRRLGGGGMAEVFLARTVGKAGFERPVAIKCILPGYAERPQFVDMFVAEAQLTAKLRHPNIVSVLDFDQDDARRLFLVMELVEGTDLDGLLATGPLPLPLVVFVIAEVVRGLGYAHALPLGADGVRGLVHRDVSPHNVLLSWAGEVKVSDFGIAKARAATDATASVLIKGKPAYMSPEQANGQPLDGASDLFAVGVMLWEMLSGQPLFATDTLESTLARVMFAPIVRPSTLRREVPADLERVALRLLERDRQARYPDADAVLGDLLACAHAPRAVIGTPAYMAPEQAKGEIVDHRADVYALGAVIYRCLTGRVPFTAKDTPALLYAVVHVMPLRPSALAAVSPQLEAFLALALAKPREARFQTATELATAFDAGLRDALPATLGARAAALARQHPWTDPERFVARAALSNLRTTPGGT